MLPSAPVVASVKPAKAFCVWHWWKTKIDCDKRSGRSDGAWREVVAVGCEEILPLALIGEDDVAVEIEDARVEAEGLAHLRQHAPFEDDVDALL